MSTALITGASSGIGYELAGLFAADKINLVLVARREDKLAMLASELQDRHGVRVDYLAMDLSDANNCKSIVDWCTSRKIDIDYLVNNAGFGDFGFFIDSQWQKQLDMINVNILSLTYLTRLLLPGMVNRKFGRVLNLASTAAFQPGPTMSVYYATKAYVLHFSEAIGNELARSGVTVTALCPGATESEFQDVANLHESKMIKGRKLPTSLSVAKFGYQAMNQGKAVAIPGIRNYMLANVVRFTPRSIVVKVARYIQDKRN
jgi:uncharacterized protein